MKKAITAILLICIIMIMASCNQGLGPGSYTFTSVHIFDHSGTSNHATIIKWYNNDTGIEVNTEEYGSLFLSEGTYILFNDKCPICD